MKNKIKILGAGISGLSAAICLAKDRDVLVVEKNPTVGYKFKNELQAYKNYDHSVEDALDEIKKIGLKIEPYNSIYKVKKIFGTQEKVIQSKNPIYYLFLRGTENNDLETLESQLLKQAKDMGVNFQFSKTTDTADIVATGTKYPNIFSFSGIFERAHIEDAVYVIYDLKYVPGGYIYILPYKDKKILVSVVFFQERKPKNMKEVFMSLIRENDPIYDIVKDSTLVSTTTGSGGYNKDSPIDMIDNRYYIGEAGGFLDPARGFGLRYAILTAKLVSKAIIENTSFSKLWMNYFGEELKLGYSRRSAFRTFDEKKLNSIFKNLDNNLDVHEYAKKRLELEKSEDD